MAIYRANVNKKDPGFFPIDYIDINELANLVEKDIDEKIKKSYIQGQKIVITFDFCFGNDDLLEELSKRYIETGWTAIIDEDEYILTLF